MKLDTFRAALAALGWTLALAACAQGSGWQDKFDIAGCNMLATGRSAYFILEPGYQLELQGGDTRLVVTVLDQTRQVDGVMTRVVEEREWKNGKLYEVARNFFAMCERTKDVFYFGEEVDFYEDGKITKHDGSWLAGTKGNRPGLIMPGAPKVGMKYYQELAPGIAMDRAEIVSVTDNCRTPAGTFKNCLKVKETSAIERLAVEYKYHAPGIGLVADEDLRLVRYGFASARPAAPQ